MNKKLLMASWWTLAVVTFIPWPSLCAAPDDPSITFFLKTGSDWKQIPFFCELSRGIGLVNAEYREEYFQKDQPFQMRKATANWNGAMGGKSDSSDIFGNHLENDYPLRQEQFANKK